MEGALAERVGAEPFHRVTPLLESWALSQVAGMPVFLKYENVQIAGSFKIRGIGHFCQQVKEGGHRAVEEVREPMGVGTCLVWVEHRATSHKGLHD